MARTLLSAFASLWVACMTSGAEPSQDVSAASAADRDRPYFLTGMLTMQDRIWAQRQIERVFDRHRIWPKDNPRPKPPFEQRVPTAVIEGKVLDSFRMSAALEQFWSRTVTPAMLQAELDRMVRDSKNPAMLRELFAALHDDPFLISEVLARPQLAGRMIRESFTADPRFQAESRARAAAVAIQLAAVGATHASPNSDWSTMDGEYHRHTFILDKSAVRPRMPEEPPDQTRVGAQEFAALAKKYITGAEGRQPLESEEGFLFERVAEKTAHSWVIESLFVPKADFSNWWGGPRAAIRLDGSQAGNFRDSGLRLPAIDTAAGCDQWAPTATMGAPLGRDIHTAVWTGAEMIIWGGTRSFGPTGYMNSGGRYVPAIDSWTLTSTLAAPEKRGQHTAVWTGSEMIVWGGSYTVCTSNCYAVYLNTGGRYDPAADAWRPTDSGTAVPGIRVGHTAVWSGMEMIIWGGVVAGGGALTYLNSGGRYDPVRDAWTATNDYGHAPDPRASHSSVWTGSEMIVWGGYDGIIRFNSGGIYDPLQDKWRTVSKTGNAPQPRNLHSAVWTGSEMIVWGGAGAAGDVNDGARYNPASNDWLTMATSGAPEARHSHTFVWSGSEMVIWGGNASFNFISGGRYNPVTNLWQATSTDPYVPSGRSLHTAVWTGTAMIVWGGTGTSAAFMNTGGILFGPDSPGNTLYVSRPTGIVLDWLPASGATSYTVRRCQFISTGCVPSSISGSPVTNQYSEPDDPNSYMYAVESVNACGSTP